MSSYFNKQDAKAGLPIESPLPEFRAVIFDMDGLAINSEPSFIAAWRQAAEQFGVHLQDDFIQALSGRHAQDVKLALQNAIGENFESDRFSRIAGKYWMEHVETHGIHPMPGLPGLLDLLDRNHIPYALATNSNGPSTAECLRRSGLDKRFPWVVNRDQVSAGKPAPDLFIAAAQRMGFSANECLALEDSAIGLMAASRAAAYPVLVKAQPDMAAVALAASYFRSLHEVTEAIRLLT